MYKVGDEVLMKAEITKVYDNGVVIKVGGLGEAFFANENIDVNKTYSQGLSDAWELARKIYNMHTADIDKIFGVNGGFYEVIRDFTAEEALAKIEDYEKEKKIKVGDVVRTIGGIIAGVVTRVNSENPHVVWADGATGDYMKSHLVKTGKHIDIEGLLKQIGE